jgi:hypothetical protein
MIFSQGGGCQHPINTLWPCMFVVVVLVLVLVLLFYPLVI